LELVDGAHLELRRAPRDLAAVDLTGPVLALHERLERREAPLVLAHDRDVERQEHLPQLALEEEEEPALVLASLVLPALEHRLVGVVPELLLDDRHVPRRGLGGLELDVAALEAGDLALLLATQAVLGRQIGRRLELL